MPQLHPLWGATADPISHTLGSVRVSLNAMTTSILPQTLRSAKVAARAYLGQTALFQLSFITQLCSACYYYNDNVELKPNDKIIM